MKLIPIFAVIAVISLPYVSLYGFNYGYWPQKYFSPYVFPQYYSGIKFVSSYVAPRYFGLFNPLNSYVVPQVIYPAVHYSIPPTPIAPVIYYNSLTSSSPILHHSLGGLKISGKGLPTHPGYRPPTMWKRIWPPPGSYNNGNNDNSNDSKGTEETTTKPEPIDKDSSTQKA